MFKHTRIYYRNRFIHIGHIQTLYYNNDIARLNNGICHAIIDDRQDHTRAIDIQEDFDYLGLTHTKIVSVHKHQKNIYAYTKKLMDEGKISMIGPKGEIKNMWEQLNCPTMIFQLRLQLGPETYANIGYTREIDGKIHIILIFDYIIKVMDMILGITDIISTTSDITDCDVKDIGISSFFESDKLNYHYLDTYHIQGFKYSKKDWPITDEHNPHLLTIKGLYNRHVPSDVLYAFYLHACQMGTVQISYMDVLLKTYLNNTSQKVFGIIDPLQVILTNWSQRTTEFVCKTDLTHAPLGQILYIDKSDFGLDINKLNKSRTCRLRHGPIITCVDVDLDEKGPLALHAVYDYHNSDRQQRCLNWISSVWGQEPIKVCYYLYNWFYTGNNVIMEPRITIGYIEPIVFQSLDKVFQLERNGYFIYDHILSQREKMPTFVRISKI